MNYRFAAKPIERTSVTLQQVLMVDVLYSANRKTRYRTRAKVRPQPEFNKRLM
jgi:hypothetical protein